MTYVFIAMSRTRAPHRLPDILRAATAVFIAQGHRGARIEEIAGRASVAPGTVHLYARTKEALFDLAVRDARHDASVYQESLPYSISDRADIIGRVWLRLNSVADLPRLRLVLVTFSASTPIDAMRFAGTKALGVMTRCP